jgi:hypothetical protein
MSDSQFLICASLVFVGVGLFQWQAVAARKLGILAFIMSSACAVAFWSDRWWMGGLTLLAWILFPLSEVVYVLRKLRVPRQRALEHAAAPNLEFPDLRPFTEDIETLGFEKSDDCDLKPSLNDQFYRLFSHPLKPVHAVIGHLAQGDVSFHFIMFLSEEKSGRCWMTWDYPLTYGLKTPPDIALHRALDCETVTDLFDQHLEFMNLNGITEEQLVRDSDPAGPRARLERTLHHQLEYNIREGILADSPSSDGSVRYSWRGTLYVAGQVFRDLVRL